MVLPVTSCRVLGQYIGIFSASSLAKGEYPPCLSLYVVVIILLDFVHENVFKTIGLPQQESYVGEQNCQIDPNALFPFREVVAMV